MRPEGRLRHNWLVMKLANARMRLRVRELHGTVVDLGCGTRPYETEILGHADFYIGLDWSHTLHGLHADAAADISKPLPVRDEVADCVVAFEVLEHLAEPAVMLAEAFRVLGHGGSLTLSVPFQWWVHEAPWDYQRFTRYGLAYQLDKAGFGDIRIEALSGFWVMWILKFNYQLTRLIGGPRPIRIATRACLIPIWWLGQVVAPWLDRLWPDERETIGYFVTARKP